MTQKKISEVISGGRHKLLIWFRAKTGKFSQILNRSMIYVPQDGYEAQGDKVVSSEPCCDQKDVFEEKEGDLLFPRKGRNVEDIDNQN